MITGVINVNKTKGYTSQDVVAVIKKTLGVKAGHTGTLDPIATGVLPVCVGKATKIADFFQAGEKEYIAVMRLGIATDTEDITGKITASAEPVTDYGLVEQAALSFTGGYEQVPPMYSAVKIDGRRLYKTAREGRVIDRPARAVVIKNIEILGFDPPDVRLRINCMKGTYIRTLVADIGAALGCGACMAELVRTNTGPFNIKNAVTLDEVKNCAANGETARFLIPADDALDYERLIVKPGFETLLRNGNKLPLGAVDGFETYANGERFFLYDGGGLCGIYRPDGDYLYPVAMFV